jgi:hypothetical protein
MAKLGAIAAGLLLFARGAVRAQKPKTTEFLELPEDRTAA